MKTLVPPPPPPPPPPHKIPIEQRYGEICIFFFLTLFTSFPLVILGALKVSFDLRNIKFCQFCEKKKL